MNTLAFRVHGMPAPQGSKRHVGNGVMVESSKKVKPWRQDVTAAALNAVTDEQLELLPLAGPLQIQTIYIFPRPKSHYGTGKNADVLKPNAPEYVSTRPDLEKLDRATFDALTAAGVWRDDAQVVRSESSKCYGPHPGAHITIRPIA